MTLKQRKTIENLPKTGYNISKASRMAGYTEGSSKAGSHYEALRKHLIEAYDTDTIKADISKYRDILADQQEWSSLVALLTLQAKITGLTKDNTITNTNVITDTDIKRLSNRLSNTQHTEIKEDTNNI